MSVGVCVHVWFVCVRVCVCVRVFVIDASQLLHFFVVVFHVVDLVLLLLSLSMICLSRLIVSFVIGHGCN